MSVPKLIAMEKLCNSLSRFEISHRYDVAKERYAKADQELASARRVYRRADDAQSAAAELLLDIESPEWRQELCKRSGNHSVDCADNACQPVVGGYSKRKIRLANRDHKIAQENYARAEEMLFQAESAWELARKRLKKACDILELKDEQMNVPRP